MVRVRRGMRRLVRRKKIISLGGEKIKCSKIFKREGKSLSIKRIKKSYFARKKKRDNTNEFGWFV